MTTCRRFTMLLLAPLATAACRGGHRRADPDERTASAASAESRVAIASDAAGRWVLDGTTCSVAFVGASVMQKHEGRFGAVEGIAEITGGDPTKGAVTIEIAMHSLAIEPSMLETHLRSADFFDVQRFPTARFASTRIAKAEGKEDAHLVTGELTLRGVTRTISFPAAIAVRAAQLVVRAELTLRRQQFGIAYPGLPDDLIADDVVVRIRIAGPRS